MVFGIRHTALAIICLFWSLDCRAQLVIGAESLCRAAIASAEAEQRIPDAFLAAIARVESGRSINGSVVAWPWTVNAEGVGSFFATKEDAIAAVNALQARGVRSIDVGCMQVNLQQHPEAFHALDQAFDPVTNARFAAGLLLSLFGQTGSWPLAAAAYHSQTPTLGAAYQQQVLSAWAKPDKPASLMAKSQHEVGASRQSAGGAGSTPAIVTRPAMIAAFGRQGVLGSDQPRPGIMHANGRSLADYRMMPTPLALRPPGKPG
jgi:hypothetical protein